MLKTQGQSTPRSARTSSYQDILTIQRLLQHLAEKKLTKRFYARKNDNATRPWGRHSTPPLCRLCIGCLKETVLRFCPRCGPETMMLSLPIRLTASELMNLATQVGEPLGRIPMTIHTKTGLSSYRVLLMKDSELLKLWRMLMCFAISIGSPHYVSSSRRRDGGFLGLL